MSGGEILRSNKGMSTKSNTLDFQACCPDIIETRAKDNSCTGGGYQLPLVVIWPYRS